MHHFNQIVFIKHLLQTSNRGRGEKKLFQRDKTFCRAGSAADCLPSGGGGGGVRESGKGEQAEAKEQTHAAFNANHKFE